MKHNCIMKEKKSITLFDTVALLHDAALQGVFVVAV